MTPGGTVRTVRGMTDTHKIASDLVPLATPVSALKPMPGNPRRGDIDAVARSYDRFGQRKPVVALADGTVIAGNHQLAAAKQLGWTHLATVRVADDPSMARAYALADNRAQELGGYDTELLADLISAVEDDGLLDASLYTLEDLDDLLALIEEASDDHITSGSQAGEHGGYDAETTDDTPTTGNAVKKGTLEEAAELYASRATRVFLAEMPNTMYVWFIEHLGAYRAEHGIESNAEAVVHLLATEREETAPAWT